MLVVVALLGLATGCGSDSDESLTKAEFTKQASAICKKGEEEKNDQLVAAIQQLEKESKGQLAVTQKQQEEIMSTELLPPLKAMSEDLAALGVPEEGSAQAEEIVEGFEAAIAEIEEDPGSALRQNDPFTEVNKLAVDYGLKFCGEI